MRKVLFSVTLVLSALFSFAQTGPALLEPNLPDDHSPIHVEPAPLTTDWKDFNGGFNVGSHIPDFSFYTVDGKEVTLSAVLRETGKPILLVTGNYSCPVYRNNANAIDSITNFYKDKLNVYVVYTLEAHPSEGAEAYPVIPPAVEQNESDNIHIKQAQTYRDRRRTAAKMRKRMNIASTIVLDGPGNEWWTNAGYAPNNAYLVDTNGVIVAKNGWFDDSMWCSIDQLLNTRSNHCQN